MRVTEGLSEDSTFVPPLPELVLKGSGYHVNKTIT